MFDKFKGIESVGKSKVGDSYLYIDCRNKWNLKLIKALSEQYYLPADIKGVGIGYLDEKNEEVKSFLAKWFKLDLDWLWINYIALDKWEKQYRLGIEEYLGPILWALPHAKKWVGLNYFKMDDHSISEIIKAARSVQEKLDFDNSSLKFDNPPNFGMEEFKISKISMEDTFVKSKKGKETAMKYFIQGIAQSKLKDSLKEIWRSDCNVESDTVERLLKEEFITSVRINN